MVLCSDLLSLRACSCFGWDSSLTLNTCSGKRENLQILTAQPREFVRLNRSSNTRATRSKFFIAPARCVGRIHLEHKKVPIDIEADSTLRAGLAEERPSGGLKVMLARVLPVGSSARIVVLLLSYFL